MGLADDADDDAALLDGLGGVLDLEDAALRGAGRGVSGWCGEGRVCEGAEATYKVTESLSYWLRNMVVGG